MTRRIWRKVPKVHHTGETRLNRLNIEILHSIYMFLCRSSLERVHVSAFSFYRAKIESILTRGVCWLPHAQTRLRPKKNQKIDFRHYTEMTHMYNFHLVDPDTNDVKDSLRNAAYKTDAVPLNIQQSIQDDVSCQDNCVAADSGDSHCW